MVVGVMFRSCTVLMAAAGRETQGANSAPDAPDAPDDAVQASIDAFFDGDASVFALERQVDEEAPESGEHPLVRLAPAA